MNQNQSNKHRLKKLMQSHDKNSRHIAALLSRVTGDHLSARTVQSWSAASELTSARPCPGWALYILECEFELMAEESRASAVYHVHDQSLGYKFSSK